MSIGAWLIVVSVIVFLMSVGWFLEPRKFWVCNGLAILLAWAQGEVMINALGFFTLMAVWMLAITQMYVRAMGHTPLSGLLLLRKKYRIWRGLEWSGEFRQPPQERIFKP